MTTDKASLQRRNVLLGLGGATILFGGISGLGQLAGAGTRASSESVDDLIFPDFTTLKERAVIIRVTLGDGGYTLRRRSNQWVMLEAGSYPVRAERLAELERGLEGLRWGEARTVDPEKYPQIGVSDPRSGGNGALIEMMDEAGEALASLIAGRKAGRVYVRESDSAQSWRAIGDLPPLYTREEWLDLSVVQIQQEAIGSVRFIDRFGNTLLIDRQAGDSARAFRPAPPNETDRLVNPFAAAAPALAISRFAPIDVKPASALETEAVARHISVTFDGLEVAVDAYRDSDGVFVTVAAIEAGEGATRAATINRRAEGWAFQLSEFDWNDFTPPILEMIEPRPG